MENTVFDADAFRALLRDDVNNGDGELLGAYEIAIISKLETLSDEDLYNFKIEWTPAEYIAFHEFSDAYIFEMVLDDILAAKGRKTYSQLHSEHIKNLRKNAKINCGKKRKLAQERKQERRRRDVEQKKISAERRTKA